MENENEKLNNDEVGDGDKERNGERDEEQTDSDSYETDDSNDNDFIAYEKRTEWSDVKPLGQNEDEQAAVPIIYSERFRSTFDYFRAILEKNEYSERAFHLTTECIKLNPFNYTVWYYRRLLLNALEKDLLKEMAFVEKVILEHTKNYQVWQHRRALVEILNDATDEKRFTKQVLALDAKNYHCWQHRQWCVKQFKLWSNEIEFIDELLEKDVRNNSAWNYRYFIIKSTNGFDDENIINREINFTIEKIELTPNNESPWNYLRGLLNSLSDDSLLNNFLKYKQIDKCLQKLNSNEETKSPFLLAFLIDIAEEKINQTETPDQTLLLQTIEIANSLANKYDVIRKRYWNHVAANFDQFYSSTNG